jgi:hypothetical protein
LALASNLVLITCACSCIRTSSDAERASARAKVTTTAEPDEGTVQVKVSSSPAVAGDSGDADVAVVSTDHAVQLPKALAHIKFSGAGSDCDHPVKVENARTATESTFAQKAWLRQVYPNKRVVEHGVGRKDGRILDAYELAGTDGGSSRACFDSTESFGAP